MNRKILGLTLALGLAAGCEFAKKTTYDGPGPQCRTVGAACTENADCCSYGCVAGVCAPGDHAGAVCATTNDCGYPDFSYTQMTCKSGSCTETTFSTCRDDADVCTGAAQCCSHHCNGAACVPNNAPVVQMGDAVQTVPRNQPFTLVNTSYDPDAGDTLSYGWTITPITGGWTISANNVKNPVFNPGANTGTYTATLDVTDNWGLTRSGSVTLNVVNTPPVVTPAAATATTPRNVALNVAMTVSDANGDTLSCTWSICRQGTATCLTAPAALTGLAGLPASSQSAAFPTGLVGTQEGDWDVALACSDGYLPATGTTTVTVTNSAPVITVPATRWYNLEYVAAATPEKLIDATAVDPNGDSPLTWSWAVAPATGATLSSTNAATVGFTPTARGVYTLTVTACDAPASNPPYVERAGDCASTDVVATVHPYIRPLTSGGGSVVDAAWRKSDDRLVAVGSDSGGTGRLWLANPAVDPGTTADAAVVLGAIPTALSVSGDGLEAVVGESTSRWQTVSLGATPAASTLWTAPFIPTGVVHNGNRGFALNGAATPSIYQLNLSTGTYASVGCTIAAGGTCAPTPDRGVSDGVSMWLLDPSASVARYSVNNGNGDLTRETSLVSVTATTLQRSSDAYLFLPGDGVKVAATLAVAGSLPSSTTHADSSLTGASLVGLAATGGTITPFNSSLIAGTGISLPHWGSSGADRALTARYVFVSNDGTRANVVVQSGAPAAWGLYTCTLPCTLP